MVNQQSFCTLLLNVFHDILIIRRDRTKDSNQIILQRTESKIVSQNSGSVRYNIYVGICLATEKERLGEAKIIQKTQEEKTSSLTVKAILCP